MLINLFQGWINRLRTLTGQPRCGMSRRRAPRISSQIESFENRTLLTVNLTAQPSWLVDDSGAHVVAPAIGQGILPLAHWTISDNEGALNYQVAIEVDGNRYSYGNTTWGSDYVDSFWYWYRRVEFATPGEHNVRIIIDPLNTVAESNELDNTYEFTFTTSQAVLPNHSYEFNNSFADLYGGPSLTSNGGTLNPSTLTFGANQGPSASALGIYDNYSIEMRLYLDSYTGYRKLIDFKDRTRDAGLYFHNGQLRFYNISGATGGPSLSAGQMAHIVLTREASSSLVTGYVNGAVAFSFTDSTSEAVFSSSQSIVHFLRDDLSVTGENATGELDSISTYPMALSASQVAELTASPHLLHFYGFDGNANDEQGSAHGTVQGATLVSGYQGQAYDYDGVNDYISAAANINPSVWPQLTMGAWVRADGIRNFGSNNLQMHTVVSHDNAGYDRTLAIDNRGDGGVDWSAFAGSANVLSGPLAKTNEWVFLAAVYDDVAQTTKLFVNEEVFTRTGANLSDGYAFINIGRNPDFQSYFDGAIDNLFIFEGALNAQQIANIREGGAPYLRSLSGVIQRPEVQVLDGSSPILDGSSQVNLGSTVAGSSAIVKTFTVTNTGDADLIVGGVTVTGQGFSIVPPNLTAGTTIVPGGQRTFQVQLATTSAGTFHGTVSFPTNDPNENPFDFALSGTITAPEIEVYQGANPLLDGTGVVTFDSSRQGTTGSAVTLTVRNAGGADLSLGTVVPPAGFSLVSSPASLVLPGQQTTFTVRMNTTTAGNVTGVLSFTTNDTDEISFEINLAGFVYNNVDLIVSDVQVTPASVESGDDLIVQWTLINQGTGAYQGLFLEEILLSTDPVLGGHVSSYGQFEFQGTLAAGESIIRSQRITLDQNLAGDRYGVVRTDSTGRVSELVESNNAAIDDVPIRIQAPDLSITSALMPVVVNSGEPTQVSWIVKNQGTAATPPNATWYDRVYFSTNTTLDVDDIVLGQVVNLSALEADQSYQNTLDVTIPYGRQGIGYLIVETDYDHDLAELIETNNTRTTNSTNVRWDPPDLRVSNVISQADAFAGQTSRVSWNVRNQGLGPTRETGWSDRVWISTDPELDESDRLVGTYSHTGALPFGESYSQTQFVTVPPDLAGTYFIIVDTDALDQVLEGPFEGNNNLADSTSINIVQTPPPDLEVSSVEAPSQAFASGPLSVTFSVVNAGSTATLNSHWSDRVYLSTDTTVDDSDTILGNAGHTGILDSGDTYTSSPTFTLPANLSGTYYVLVRTDHAGDVFGDDRTNNDHLDAIPLVIDPPPADLDVIVVTIPATALSGSTISLDYTVKNIGPTTTSVSIWQDQVYLSVNTTIDPTDHLLGTFDVTSPLPADQGYSTTQQVTLPPGITGTFYVVVRTDSGDQVVELFQQNNDGRADGRLNIIQPPADLTVTHVVSPATVRAGGGLSVNYRVENSGLNTTLSSSWNDRIYLSTDATFDTTDLLLGTQTRLGGLAAGTAYEISPTFTVPNELSGNYYVIVITDSENRAFEFDEVDNIGRTATPTQIVSSPADLVVSTISAPVAGVSGGSVPVDWKVKNEGIGDTITVAWRDRIFLSHDAVLDESDLMLKELSFTNFNNSGAPVPLAVGTSVNRSGIVDIPFGEVGDYYLFVVTDTNDVVFEGNQNANNTSAAQPINLSHRLADLQVTSLTEPPTKVAAGTPFGVTWTVQNRGNGTTNSNFWYDTVYLSVDSFLSPDDIRLTSLRQANPLPVNGAYSATAQVAAPATLNGEFFMLVKTDDTDRVLEDSLEGNNTISSSARITVTGGMPEPIPDLAPVTLGSPTEAISGQSVDLNWTVTNLGETISHQKWYDSVYLSLDQTLNRGTDIYLGFRDHEQSLAHGETYHTDDQFPVPASLFGAYYVLVVLDGGNSLNEGTAGEANNLVISDSPINFAPVPPADLSVGTITIPANGFAGQVATLDYSIHNLGSSAARGTWFDTIYLSIDDQWDIGDPLIGRVQHLGDVAAGGTYSESLTALLPAVLPGEYHVIIRSDIRNQLAEISESNNIAGSLNRIEMDVVALTPGTEMAGTLQQGQSLYYKVDVPAGETLVVELDGADVTGFNELYLSSGNIPSRIRSNYAAIEDDQPDQRLTISSTSGQTYYIFVYGSEVASAGTDFVIQARLVQFDVFDKDFGIGGTAGNRTIVIRGAKFDRTTTATLKGPDGFAVDAISTYYVDDTEMYATFDLRNVPVGTYDVIISRDDGQTKTVPASFAVEQVIGTPEISAFLQAPARVRRSINYTFNVVWANDTLNDVQAPLLTVSNSVPFGLETGSISAGMQYTFLGTNTRGGPAGIILPGQAETTAFFAYSDAFPGSHEVFLSRSLKRGGSEFDWAEVRAVLLPRDTDTAGFDQIFNRMIERIGTTNDEVQSALSRAATLLPSESGSNRDFYNLLTIELAAAEASLGTSLSGRLATADLSVDFGGRDLRAQNTTTGEIFTTRTFNDGSFVFPSVSTGDYTFDIEGALVAETSANPISIANGISLTSLVIDVTRGGTIEGQVIDAQTGLPLAGAVVHAVAEDGSAFQGTTDIQGRYTLDGLTFGSYLVYADAPDYGRVRLTAIDVSGVQPVPIDLALSSGAIISGEVRLPDLSNTEVLVSARPIGQDDAASSYIGQVEDGRFQIMGLPAGTYAITITADGFVPQHMEVALGISESRTLPVTTLVVESILQGTLLTNATDLDLTGISIAVYLNNDFVTSTASQADGTFEFRGLGAGIYTLRVTELNAFTDDLEVTVGTSETIAGLSMLVQRGAVISGTVRNSLNGSGLGGIVVQAIDAEGRSLLGITKDDGTYHIDNVTRGDYLITTVAAGATAQTHITVTSLGGSIFTAELSLTVNGRVNGFVQTSTGDPLPDTIVYLVQNDQVIATSLADATGRYEFFLLQAGAFELRAGGLASFSPALDITVQTGETLQRNLIAGTSQIDLKVTSGVSPVEGASVTVYQITTLGPVIVGSDLVDADGKALFEHLVAGDYLMQIQGNGRLGASTLLTVGNNTIEHLNVDMITQARLSGKITGTLNVILRGALIAAVSTTNPDDVVFAISDADGNYELLGMTTGTYSLSVLASGYLGYLNSSVAVGLETQLDVSLIASTTTLSGRAVSSDGTPIPGATIEVRNADGLLVGIATADSQGRFSISTAVGTNLTVRVNSEGFREAIISGVTIAAGATMDLSSVALTSVAIGATAFEDSSINQKFTSPNGKLQETAARGYFGDVGELLEGLFSDFRRDDEVASILPLPAGCEDCLGVRDAAVAAVLTQDNTRDLAERAQDELQQVFTDFGIALAKDVANALIELSGVAKAIKPLVRGSKIHKLLEKLDPTLAQEMLITAYELNEEIPKTIKKLKSLRDPETSTIEKTRDFLSSVLNIVEVVFRLLSLQFRAIAKVKVELLDNIADVAGYADALLYFEETLTESLQEMLDNLTFKNMRSMQTKLFLAIFKYQNAIEDYNAAVDDAISKNNRYLNCLDACRMEDDEEDDDIPDEEDIDDEHTIIRPASQDPNDILGPVGFGPENWIVADQPLDYMIRFENDPDLGTAPAQVVSISQTLDSDLDPRTFRLGAFGFGESRFEVPENQSFYSTRLDLTGTLGIYVDVFAGIDVAQSRAFWTIRSVDPLTGDLPEDPNVGFLPLNLVAPEGDGFVSYTVRARSTVTSGTRVDAQARIVFDINEPIDTPAIFNTLDAVAPSSRITSVTTQPSSSDGRFLVQWSGEDDAAGSSLAEYSIYVSTDNGPYQLWLARTPLTEAYYTGPNGVSYSFYSVAKDYAGNIELAPAVVDAAATVGNRAPRISDRAFTLAENTVTGTSLGTIPADDLDAGQSLTYSILSGNESGAFYLDRSTGELKIADGSRLDFEAAPSFSLVVQVTDNGTSALSSTALVSVTLTNVNEPPQLSDITVSIPENSAAGIIVANLAGSDPDAGQTLTYSILSGNNLGLFAIDRDSGQISLADGALPNFELSPEHLLQVQVSDNQTPALVRVASIVIHVTDLNEPPSIDSLSVMLPENSNTTTVAGVVTAHDPDSGQALTFDIVDGNPRGTFTIDLATGVLSVADGRQLDFETTSTFHLTVRVTDNGVPALTTTTNVTITLSDVNESPRNLSLSSESLAELQPSGTVVGLLSAIEEDAADPLTFTFVTGSGDQDNTRFRITNNQLILDEISDYETRPQYHVRVRVTDSHGLWTERGWTIQISNVPEAPSQVSLSASAMVEESPPGTIIGTLSTVDGDLGGVFNYALVNGAGSDDNSRFTIVGGLLKTSTRFDYDSQLDHYTIRIRSTDETNLSLERSFTITLSGINDLSPTFSSAATFQLAENSTVVGTVMASDLDLPAQLIRFSITGGVDGSLFSMTDQGTLTFKSAPDFENPLDENRNNVYEVQVTANDGQGRTTSQTLSITVTGLNDNSPHISPPDEYILSENTSHVGTLIATDADLPVQSLTFQIVGGADAELFSLTSLGQLSFKVSPDYEVPRDQDRNNIYDVQVAVTDTAGQSTSRTLRIVVTGVNDNTPTLTSPYQFLVPENSTLVGTMTANDADQPIRALTISIMGGVDADRFELNANGVLSFRTAADFENPTDLDRNNVYEITVAVLDGDGRSSNWTLLVIVEPLNDHSPVITSNSNLTIVENSATVGMITATDADAPMQTIGFSITGGTDASLFTITNAGVLVCNFSPDFEAPRDADGNNVYELEITVSDGAGRRTTQRISIAVSNMEDVPPVFQTSASFQTLENEKSVGVVSAASPENPDVLIQYTLTGPDATFFNIDPATGLLSFKVAPDFESPSDQGFNNVYDITVIATNALHQALKSSQSLTINVAGTNEHAPQFDSASPTFTIQEHLPTAMLAGRVIAQDADRPTTGLSYSLISGNESGAFQLDPLTGELTIGNAAAIDFETIATFTLTIRVTDNGTPLARTADAVVVINLTNVVESPTITFSDEGTVWPADRKGNPLAADALFIHRDATALNLSQSKLSASIVAGKKKKDVLGILKSGDTEGLISTKKKNVLHNNVKIGTFTGGKGKKGELVVTFTTEATVPAIEALLRRISLRAKEASESQRSVRMQITDGRGGILAEATKEVLITGKPIKKPAKT